MGIAVADEAAAAGGLIDGGLEDPEVLLGAAQGEHGLSFNPAALLLLGQMQQITVGYVFSVLGIRLVSIL